MRLLCRFERNLGNDALPALVDFQDAGSVGDDGAEVPGIVAAEDLDAAFLHAFAQKLSCMTGIFGPHPVAPIGRVPHFSGDFCVNRADVVSLHTGTQPFNIISRRSNPYVGPHPGVVLFPSPQRDFCFMRLVVANKKKQGNEEKSSLPCFYQFFCVSVVVPADDSGIVPSVMSGDGIAANVGTEDAVLQIPFHGRVIRIEFLQMVL